jgi:hypothetical protein
MPTVCVVATTAKTAAAAATGPISVHNHNRCGCNHYRHIGSSRA